MLISIIDRSDNLKVLVLYSLDDYASYPQNRRKPSQKELFAAFSLLHNSSIQSPGLTGDRYNHYTIGLQ